jgi:amino acid adenylation domain-containing protein
MPRTLHQGLRERTEADPPGLSSAAPTALTLEPDSAVWERVPLRAETLATLFERQAVDNAGAVAVEFPKSDDLVERLTYAELNNRANQLAHHLRSLGAGPDVIVGISATRSIDLITAVLAVVKAGAAYLPLDPCYPRERLAVMIEDSGAAILLTEESRVANLPARGATVVCLDRFFAEASLTISGDLVSKTGPEDLAYIIYTSGSTGRPKGVAMPQGPLLNLLRWQKKNWSARPNARTLQFTSLNFDVSFQEIFSTWHAGGTLVLISERERRDSDELIRFIAQHKVERLFLPFVALKQLADAAVRGQNFPESLREVITAGEQLQITPQIREFFARLPECTLENQYGPSEAHVVTAFRLAGPSREWPVLPCIGSPIENVSIHILDSTMKPVTDGETGEVYIGGLCLARGYLNRPELTAERFIPDPLSKSAGERLYKTGDLGRWLPDGTIEFFGRADQQVKIRGFRIELGEIEAVLSSHPKIREVATVARETAPGEKQLVAYVVSNNGPPDPRELRQFVAERVPPYAVPSLFVTLPALPLTPSGKVDRRALPEPGDVVSTTSDEVKMPRDPLEMQIKLVFEKLLNCRPVSIDTSFFEMGGDSLQALRLVVEIERVTGSKLPLEILYKAPSVEALATTIREKKPAEFSCLVPLQPLGSRPPFFLVHTTPGDVLGYGNLIFHLDPEQPSYGFQSQGFLRPELGHETVEEMAAHYVKLMRTLQPHGPYFIGGWCYGGILAVEMAQQLQAAGEPVAPLLLIETPAPAPSWRLFGYYARRLGCLFRMSPPEWFQYFREKIRYYRGLRRAAEMRFKRLETTDHPSAEVVEEYNRHLEKLERVYDANLGALYRYSPRRYAGKIVLFNAAEPDPAVIRDPLYGWPGLAAEIQAHVIPGNHDTILMEPHVQVLARKLTAHLTEAQGNPQPFVRSQS